MSRFRIKKQPLIAVAGVVWLLAGLNIADLEGERHHVVRFFDRKSYMMMAIMMSFGIGMRAAGFFPDWFIAFFYTGLGLALALAGANYIMRGVLGRAWAFHGSKGETRGQSAS